MGLLPVAVLGWATSCNTGDGGISASATYPVYRPSSSPRFVPPRRDRPSQPAQSISRYAPPWYPRGRPISRRWTHIVIHHSATPTGGAKDFDRYHRKTMGWDELGYHFVIGNGTDTLDGFIEVGPRWHKQKHGAHCKTPGNYYNEHGIGICLVGDFTETRPTPRQLASLNRLVRFLCEQRGIPPERVIGHGAVTGKTRCPGRYFPLAAVQRALRGPTAATVLP